MNIIPENPFITNSNVQPRPFPSGIDNVNPASVSMERCGNCRRDKKGCKQSVGNPEICTWCELNGYKCSPLRNLKRRKLARFKCQQCRTKKIKCEPEDRQWPTKCLPCFERNEVCSEPQEAVRRKKKRSHLPVTGASSNISLEDETAVTTIMKSPQDQVEISKPATVNNYKHFTEKPELENPITEGQQDRMGVSDLVGSGVPMEEAEGLDSPGSVKAAESLADNSSTTDPGASDKALTAHVELPQSQMASLNRTGMESFGPVIEDLSGLASINTRPKTPVHRSGYMETPTNALFVTQGCSPLYIEGSFGNIDPERAPSPLVSYPSERQNFVDELETPDFLSHDVLLCLGKFQEFANYARSAEISRIPEARAYQIKQRTREQYPGILKKAIKVSRQLEQQGNYSDVEKLYRIILDCQEQLKDWLPLYYEENISVLLASIYEGVSGAFSRAELLEKTINFMKPDECRLPATMDKLFVAYTDSCRELASLGTLEIKTPLLLAVEFGNPAVVSFILEKEEEKHYINIADMSGRTPISLAVAKNATEIVRILIDNGAMHKLDQPYSDGTPLEIATREDSFECFRLLFDLGVGTDKFLFAAIQHDRVRMVIWLLDQGVNIHTVTWDSKFDAELTPLGMAVSRKRPSLVILLLERGADITKAGYAFDRRYCLSALCCAAANRDTVMVNMLIACGAAINETASHRERILPLCNAISRGFTDVTILLLEKGANPNTLTSLMDVMIYPLLIACNRRSCDLSLVEKLLEMGAHVNGFYFQRPLLIACRRAHEHLVKLLLSKGADVNLLSEEPTGRFSALQAACKCGIDGIIKILLENGANVNLRGRGTVTPLQLACKRGSERVVEWLIEKGADVNADAGVHIHAQSRYTALQTATQSGNIKVVKILLQHGAKVHIGVLGHAVKIGSWEMVKLLLDSGADANEREHIDPPSSGETILDWVDQLVEYSPQQYHEIRLLLIRYGAKTRVQLGPVAIEIKHGIHNYLNKTIQSITDTQRHDYEPGVEVLYGTGALPTV